jgi:hypothetical protein
MPILSYEDDKERSARYRRKKWADSRDIGIDYPDPGDLKTRKACERDFRRFCEVYFPNAFNLAWSEDHLRVIARMEDVVLEGGLFVLAMPRGSGKTTLSIRGALWALLYGHRRFVALIAATEKRAIELLDAFKTELSFNERLIRDFRQVCYPIVRLENNGRKAGGQLFAGEQTLIDWSEDRLTFPTMPDDVCDGVNVSGSTVTVAGLTGAIKGQSHTLVDGTIIRPELVIPDDPQTRESAMSLTQSITRAEIIMGDVLGMAGPGKKIAMLMPCTITRNGDMADVMLDREKNPEMNGIKTKMVYEFPVNMKLWEEYKRIREDAFRADKNGSEATEFYRAHRAEMDEGSRVGWADRYYVDEISALQHAMNLRFRNERAFFAEYQNEPLPEEEARSDDLTPDQIAAKVNRRKRGEVPISCNHVTSFIDIQGSLLYYVVAAWEDDFTGYVLDYGTYPDQKRPYFALHDAKHTLSHVFPTAGLEGQIYAGLEALTSALLTHEWPRDDGAYLRIERCLIDANWGTSTDTIYKFCRQSEHSAVLTPSHGKYVGPANVPMREYRKMPGDRVGHNWRMPNVKGKREVRKVLFDSNYWKTFIHRRLSVAMGDRGCLSLFGEKPETHRLFADHLCAEYRTATTQVKSERVVDVWQNRPGRPDNHWFDGIIGCAVAASMQGVSLPETTIAAPPKKHRVTFADLRARQSGQRPPS